MIEKKLRRNTIFNGNFMKLHMDDVEVNDQETKRLVVEHNGGVSIIAITEEKKLLLVKQFRYPVNQYTYETPAGKLDKDLSIHQTALEELEEETGYTSNNLTFIGKYFATPGYSSEVIHVYFTDKVSKLEEAVQGDEFEFIDKVEVTLAEAKQMISEGKICDFRSIHGVMVYEQYLNDLEK